MAPRHAERCIQKVAGEALTRAVASLREDVSPETIARVIELIDLVVLLGRDLPFNAQTRFYEVWERSPAEQQQALLPVATRLGFEAGARSDSGHR